MSVLHRHTIQSHTSGVNIYNCSSNSAIHYTPTIYVQYINAMHTIQLQSPAQICTAHVPTASDEAFPLVHAHLKVEACNKDQKVYHVMPTFKQMPQ